MRFSTLASKALNSRPDWISWTQVVVDRQMLRQALLIWEISSANDTKIGVDLQVESTVMLLPIVGF